MKKNIIIIPLLLLCVATLFAQAPEKFSYQAVVRNASNSLVANAQVGVRVSILQGSANGSAVYVETQTATTNANGLVTLSIGGGSVQQGTFASIDWANGPFFLQTETDLNGGSNYTVSTTQQLLSVPYALYAKMAGNGFSGDYNDLTNKPQNVSTFNNDAGYITMDSVPEIPTNVSAFTNDAGYVTASLCEGMDVCALANLVVTLQQQLEDLQAQLDSVDFIIDTAITHTTFICGISTMTDIDGNVYNTVQIGDQCWMRQNLRTTHYSDSTAIPEGTGLSSTEPYYYDNSNSEIPLLERGYLYNWSAVMHGTDGSSANPSGVQGICPTGWHVPSDAEWSQLTQYVSEQDNCRCSNDQSYIAKSLASRTYWNTSTNICAVGNDLNTNNTTGFSALPAGLFNLSGFIYSLDYGTHFWSATESASDRAWERSLGTAYPYVGRSSNYKHDGYSVRCVRDESTPSANNPTATTSEATNVTGNSATLNGSITNPDNVTITAQGFEWKVAEGGSYTQVAAIGPTMTYELTGLAANTSYTYRAFVTYGETTAYGAEVTFTTQEGNPVIDGLSCPGALTVTDIDGNVYSTVQIGNQCWMRQNLRTTHYSDSTEIPLGTTDSYTDPYRYVPNNDETNVAAYGYLYNWPAMMHGANHSESNPSGVQGICPTGWHAPSAGEWEQLQDYVRNQSEFVCGGDYKIGKALAAATGWDESTSNCAVGNEQSTNNATGFSALPAGCYGYPSYVFGGAAGFWTTSSYNGDYDADHRDLQSYGDGIFGGSEDRYIGFSIRCVRN